eukprot:g28323.t1
MSELPSFKWLIFGCGGVGGYFGARIAQVKGQRVSYIVRNKALAALKEHGVRITSICGDVQVPPSELGPILDSQALDKEEKFVADVIMLGCKAWEAKDCLQMCEPWCGPETLVLPLQNGVEGLSTIRDIVTSWGKGHALAGCCNIVSAIAEPGHIKHWAANPPYITFGEFLGAATPKTLQVKAILDAAPGMDGNLEEDALAKIWEKFTFICSTTSVQAITGPHATQDMIPAIPELLDTWRAAMHEIVALCHSYGIKYDLKQVDQRPASGQRRQHQLQPGPLERKALRGRRLVGLGGADEQGAELGAKGACAHDLCVLQRVDCEGPPTFVEAQVKVHEVLRSWSFTRLLVLDHHNSAMGAMELRPFLQQQRELCEHADLDTTADAAREVLDEAIKKLMTNTDDWLSQDARLMKMMRGRNVSVFAKRQAAEREAYRKKLCEFNRSLIGNFIRLVDVIQQSCLVDLVVSKSWYLLDRFARSSKLFQTSPTFGNAPHGESIFIPCNYRALLGLADAIRFGLLAEGIPLALEPGKKDFQEGMQQVLEQILAVCKVPTVVSYRKYLRHFKQDVVGTANPTDVIRNDQTFRTSAGWGWRTKHPAGFLAIEVSALLKDAVRHVTSSIKTMQSQLSALALESCKQAAVRYHEVNQKLQERPKGLESLVEYVRTFKRIEADLPNLKALKSSVEDMYATLAQHNIRSVAADDFQRDLMTQRDPRQPPFDSSRRGADARSGRDVGPVASKAVTFENDTMPGAQFFLNEQEETAVTEVANPWPPLKQVDVMNGLGEDEIVAGMASDPSCLTQAFQVLEYLDKVGQKLDDFEKTFKYLNDRRDCYVLFMQQPQDLELLEEARQTWELRYRLWVPG